MMTRIVFDFYSSFFKGCASLENSLTPSEKRGLNLITSSSNMCLVESINCCLHFENEQNRVLKQIVARCPQGLFRYKSQSSNVLGLLIDDVLECGKSDPCSECLKQSKKKFNIVKKLPETWMKYGFETPSDIEAPSSIADILKIEKMYPNYKFHVFEIADYFRKIYTTPINNRETQQNIFLLRLFHIDSTGELLSHWAPIVSIDQFLDRQHI